MRLPEPLTMVALAGLGGVIGSRFSGLRVINVLRLFPVGLAALISTATIGGVAGWLVAKYLHINIFAGILAFSPGSIEMMIAISIALNQAPAYVAAHHVARTLLLLAFVPWWVRKIARGKEAPTHS